MKLLKKRIPIIILAILIVGGMVLYLSDKLQPVKEDKNRTLAMYLENDAGEYVISNDSKFPTDGYVLDHAECKNGGTVTQDSTTKKISASVFVSDFCNLYFAKDQTAAEFLVSKSKTGDSNELVEFSHEATAQTPAQKDYRYTGETPKNYISYNDEVWRIIGVFETEDEGGNYESRIKIVRNESIGSLPWNNIFDSYPVNEWDGGSLYLLLNSGAYYNRSGEYATVGLQESSKDKIDNVKWYLGRASDAIYDVNHEADAKDTVYSDERSSNPGGNDDQGMGRAESINVFQKVGLIYPSDVLFGGWLWNVVGGWTQTPSYYVTNAVMLGYNNLNGNASTIDQSEDVFPTLYLKPDVKILDGDGTQDNPYTLE